jgi:uncharacterized membrane protein YgcG
MIILYLNFQNIMQGSQGEYRREIILKVLEYFVQYDFLADEEILFLVNHITTIIDYFHITIREYTIFLSPSDYQRVRLIENQESKSRRSILSCIGFDCGVISNPRHREISLREELERYNVAIISTEHIKSLLYLIQIINRFYRRYPENDLISGCFVEISKILARQTGRTEYHEYHHLYTFNPKEYSFYENQILPNILYKKIRLSKMIQFISLEHYAHKKCEYMLRSFSQIAEELGAVRIKIKYNYDHHQERERGREITIGGRGANLVTPLSIKRFQKERESEGNNLNFNFAYSNNNYINLNEYFLSDKILNENKFLLCREDYESNIELKYLISARCKNLIEKYYTQFKHQTMNSVEMRIYALLKEFHLDFQWSRMKSESIEITLQIDFLNILEYRDLIDGGNIYPLKEGYIYLKNILERDQIPNPNDQSLQVAVSMSVSEPTKKFDDSLQTSSDLRSLRKFVKYINFLKAHFYCIQNGHIYLAYEYAYKNQVMKIYHQAIEMNFTEDEMMKYVEEYWMNQREWYHFIMLRDVILRGSDNVCDKLHFVTFQYMNIFHRKYHLLEMMEEQLKRIVPEMIGQKINEAVRRFAKNEYTHEDMVDYNSDDEKRIDQMKHQERVSREKILISGRTNDSNLKSLLPPTIYEKIENNSRVKSQEMSRANVTFGTLLQNALQGYQWIDDRDDDNSSGSSGSGVGSNGSSGSGSSGSGGSGGSGGSSGSSGDGTKEKVLCTLYKQYSHTFTKKGIGMDVGMGVVRGDRNGNMGDQFDSDLFKQHLEKDGFKARVIELVLKGAKGTFYYANGISENAEDPDALEEIMMSVITYYYRDTIQVLQESVIQKMVNIEKYKMIDIMTFLREVVRAISKWYIHKYKYVYNAAQEKSLIELKRTPIRNVRNVVGSVTGMYDSLQKHADHDHSSPLQIPGTRRNSYDGTGGAGGMDGDANMRLPSALPLEEPRRLIKTRSRPVSRPASLFAPNASNDIAITIAEVVKKLEEDECDGYDDPSTYPAKPKKPSLIEECETIFIKFIIKWIHYQEKTSDRYDTDEKRIREVIAEEIPREMLFTNYRKHRIYFTYQNLESIVEKLKGKTKSEST